jgi:hypothetical protein
MSVKNETDGAETNFTAPPPFMLHRDRKRDLDLQGKGYGW